ncbi:uncharacterized protein LOC143912534 [Arctopsyche grandis]|uniref:uncharacterized protein LOC143912534 n=1 Tax=Arctopsyche grandis TaxID=121162 RepID=UPI00406DA04D
MVERFHRQLKAAIMCHQDEGWTEALPTVLLGIRSAWKEDLNATSAELVYGQPLRLPGEFLAPQRNGGPNTAELAERLRSQMARLRPSPPRRHGTRSTFIFKDLHTSDQVFLRHDAAKGPLQPPYDGPYRVLKRGPKLFTLRIKDSNVTVSVDRIKPAYMESSGEPPERAERAPQENAEPQQETGRQATTRTGRRVRWPAHLDSYIP